LVNENKGNVKIPSPLSRAGWVKLGL